MPLKDISMILVTGGAGYIGSHYVLSAIERGDEIVVLDNMVYGHPQAVLDGATLIQGDMGDAALLDKNLFRTFH